MADGTHLFLLRPEGDGTRVEQVAQMKLKGPVMIMTPIVRVRLAWTLRGDNDRLKAYLARQTPAWPNGKRPPATRGDWLSLTDECTCG